MPAHILLIDDSVAELRVLVHMLKGAGYQITLAHNGSEGIQRAVMCQPDLVLLDVRMPFMDGFVACRHLKAEPLTQHIPVIFLSAANDTQSRLDGLRLGACDYITKPPVEEEVLLRVAIHLPRTAPAQPPEGSGTATSRWNWRTQISDTDQIRRLVVFACDSVMHQPGRGWSQDSLAEKVGTNRKRLNDEFKQVFGITVMAWVREYRMQQAAQWLRHRHLNVQAIAQDLGFDSAAHFSTVFRTHHGVSPTEYRQKLDTEGDINHA